MKVLHAHNRHRGGGGANNATQATIDLSRDHGLEVNVYSRGANDMSPGIRGRLQIGLGVLWGRQSIRQFVSLLETFKPDIVHVHEIYPMISPWILPQCTKRRIPVIMSCVDYRITCPVVTHFQFRERRPCTRCLGGREYHAVAQNCRGNLPESMVAAVYGAGVRALGLYDKHVSRYIAPSPFARRWFVEHAGIDPARMVIVPPAVRIPTVPSDATAGSYVAYAGRFSPEKGIDVFATAARKCRLPFRMARNVGSLVSTKVPPGLEVIVTEGPADLEKFFRAARIVVMPSLWYETFGLVGAEAMSYGIPVIGSRLGALSDLIEDGVNGLLFQSGDADDLAEKVTRLWHDRELCRRMGAAGREKAENAWRPERHIEGILEVYREVLRAS